MAGGMGTRLRPVTDLLPKPLVALAGRPIIEWQIRYLKRFGIREMVVASGYRSGQIERFLGRMGGDVHIEYSVEAEPLGTGGAIRMASEVAGRGGVLVVNGDIITDIDLQRMQGDGSCIAAVPLRTKFGVINFSGGRVTNFLEKCVVKDRWMNAGIYYLSSDAIADLPVRGDIERTLFPAYARSGRLRLERFQNAAWYSIDSLKDLEECSRVVESLF